MVKSEVFLGVVFSVILEIYDLRKHTCLSLSFLVENGDSVASQSYLHLNEKQYLRNVRVVHIYRQVLIGVII